MSQESAQFSANRGGFAGGQARPGGAFVAPWVPRADCWDISTFFITSGRADPPHPPCILGVWPIAIGTR